MLIKRVFVFIMMLFSVDMFRLIYFPKHALYGISFVFISLMIATVLLLWIYDRSESIKANFSGSIGIILLSVLLSMVGASTLHGQNFGLTAWVQRGMYFYFFYFLLHGLRFKAKDVEKFVAIFSILYIVFFLIQFAVFPRLLFDIRADEARGTIRIFLPGGAFATLGFFMTLHYFFKTNKLFYVGIAGMIYLTIVLQGTRQNMGVIALAAVLFYSITKDVKSKLTIGFLGIIAVMAIFMIFGEYFMNLVEMTEGQVGAEDDDIRMKAARFFLFDFFPTPLAYLIGNGEAHGASPYGMQVASYKLIYHFFQSDVGIIGDFSKYGAFFIVGVISIYIKIFSTKGLKRFPYVKYYFFVSIVKIILSSDFAYSESIVTISMIFY